MTTDFHSLTEQFERVYSRRLALRQATLSDAWPLYEATRNPLFNRHLLWEQPNDDTVVLDRMDAIVEASRKGRLAALSAVVKKTGEWVALYRFQPYAANPEVLEMGIWCHDRFWYGRYSLELVQACIDAAFTMSDVPVLLGAASPDNRSSCKLMELSGMSPTKLVYRANEAKAEVELQEFEITREAWAAARKEPTHKQVPMRASALPIGASSSATTPSVFRGISALDPDRGARVMPEKHSGPRIGAEVSPQPDPERALANNAELTRREQKLPVTDSDQAILEM